MLLCVDTRDTRLYFYHNKYSIVFCVHFGRKIIYMAECVVFNIGERVTGMKGEMVRCGSCEMERQCMVSECKLCEVLARNVASRKRLRR